MKAIVLAGGTDQIALIEELHQRDIEVYLIDYFENPPAKPFVEKHFQGSTLDTEFVQEVAVREKVDLIVTACTDQALLTMAKVSETLSLPCYISYEIALNVTNKSYMKKIMQQHNIPTARYTVIYNCDEVKAINFDYPLVIKPADCNSSKGVRKVTNQEDMDILLVETLNLSRTHTAIIEEYKEGKEVSADLYIENGTAYLLCVTESTKIRNNTGTFTILQSHYPVTNDEENFEIQMIAQKIADVFHLKNTPLLVQLIMKDGKFYVLEFSARMGGGSKYKLIEVLTGVNIMRLYTDLILGKNPKVNPKPQVHYARMNYVYCSSGNFQSLKNFDLLKEEGVLKEYFQYKTLGMTISKAETSSDRAAGFLLTGMTEEEIINKMQKADKMLAVLNDAGQDIMIHGLYE